MPVLLQSPGSIVSARGREWIVQPGSTETCLRLRPMTGSEADECVILPEIEFTPPAPAGFGMPEPDLAGTYNQAVLLRDAMQLKLRNGAGPFRSFGNIAVEPRAYQLVPLLMALRQPVVRLLVADDVGVGKTIEGGLVLRELLDRGEIARCAVLCPPHLVDQWCQELKRHFNINAVALTASSAARLERDIPSGESLFTHYPFVVISLDYIKNDNRRDNFFATAPECVIVDEAHTCTLLGPGIQKRWELLEKLAENPARHMVFLSATPHSGNEQGFFNLLSLLNPEFKTLQFGENKALREKLSDSFVQRRRHDIEEWQSGSEFPVRLQQEATYALSGKWQQFFNDVYNYCSSLALRHEAAGSSNGIVWYATLALLRCASSSPGSAIKALSSRLNGLPESESEESLEANRVYDDVVADSAESDFEPRLPEAEDKAALRKLVQAAEALVKSKDDPKLARLVAILKGMLKEGSSPVVFCRYVATANYVAVALKTAFPDCAVRAVTGESPSDAREAMIEELAESSPRILVCTDCLSEGINLQEHFNAIVHYDLAWNPTRHEQRNGRVDRFGQTRKQVKCVMLYGQDNPVDGLVLNVILHKADKIRRELGVSVPIPENDQRVSQAIVKAVLLRESLHAGGYRQTTFDDLLASDDLPDIETSWTLAAEKAKANHTLFAQRSIKPQEVLPEWRKSVEILGGPDDVERFVRNACAALNAPLESAGDRLWRLAPAHLPDLLRERLDEAGVDPRKPLAISFHSTSTEGAVFIHRSHPLVVTLAEYVMESAIAGPEIGQPPLASRCAVALSNAVAKVTVVLLLRLRHQLRVVREGVSRTLVAEETVSLAAEGYANPRWIDAAGVKSLLEQPPAGNLSSLAVQRSLAEAFAFVASQQDHLDALARSRAEALLQDHRRVRDAAGDRGRYAVEAVLPADVMGVYVLLPGEL